MSRRLRDFVNLISQEVNERQDQEIASFVSWLRRRNALLKNLETDVVIELIRHAKHILYNRDDIIVKQGTQRDSSEPMRFFIILHGSTSMFVNPFISQGSVSGKTFHSSENASRTPSSSEKLLVHPKSAASKRTTSSYVSQTFAAVSEYHESDISDDESEISIDTDHASAKQSLMSEQSTTRNMTLVTRERTPLTDHAQVERRSPVSRETAIAIEQDNIKGQIPPSRASKKSRKETARTKLGNFIVKYEKGKYFGDDAVLDDGGCYTASVKADETTNVVVLEEEYFNRFIKAQHEQDVMDLFNFVDIHPFFCNLPFHSKGFIQLSLKTEQYNAGSFIVKQGDPINRLIFVVSGSAEVIIDPSKHRYQYPEYWPFETCKDVYFNEFQWLRESRRRVYKRQYDFHGEVTRRSHGRDATTRKTVHVCEVQNKEVVGITEILLDLQTHMQSLRCMHDCEVYTLGLRPFRRIVKKKNPEILHVIRAYVQMKLRYRIEMGIGEQVPFLNSLYVKLQKEFPEKTNDGHGTLTKSNVKLKKHELELLHLLEWFKLDKAPLITHIDPNAIKLKEVMKEKAKVRENIRQRSTELSSAGQHTFFRSGCMVALRTDKQPMSLHRLRDPFNEIVLRLRMEGTFIKDEDELEELLLRYSESPEEDEDISRQANRVVDEEYNLFRYRRHGNKLVCRFKHMMETRDATCMHLETDRTFARSVTLKDDDCDDTEGRNTATSEDLYDKYERALTRATTYKSVASTYRTLQFQRRSLTPRTLDMKIKDFHIKYGGSHNEINNLPCMRRYQHDEGNIDDEPPLPGGKVFVTKIPCVTCRSHVMLKNHAHIRCQMLHSLPMNKVKGYIPEHTAYY